MSRITSYNVCYTKLLREVETDFANGDDLRMTGELPEFGEGCIINGYGIMGMDTNTRSYNFV